jgi:hypothetical protein
VPLLLHLGPLFFPDYSFWVHNLVNWDEWHLLAHAMASDFSVTCQRLLKRTNVFLLRIKLRAIFHSLFDFKFDGYTGFAIYSSISQGLDEITYGGRRSRRNSITENSYSYQGSILQNSLSAENISDEFSSTNFWTNFGPKTTCINFHQYYGQYSWNLRYFEAI